MRGRWRARVVGREWGGLGHVVLLPQCSGEMRACVHEAARARRKREQEVVVVGGLMEEPWLVEEEAGWWHAGWCTYVLLRTRVCMGAPGPRWSRRERVAYSSASGGQRRSRSCIGRCSCTVHMRRLITRTTGQACGQAHSTYCTSTVSGYCKVATRELIVACALAPRDGDDTDGDATYGATRTSTNAR